LITSGRPCLTWFGVANAYIIENNEQLGRIIKIKEGLISEKDHSERRLRPIKNQNITYYATEQLNSALSHFFSVRTEEKLLNFTHKFGLLGIHDKEITSTSTTGVLAREILITIDKVEDLLLEAKKIRRLIRLYGSNYEYTKHERELVIESLNQSFPLMMDIFKKSDDITLRRAYVNRNISMELGGVKPTANFDSKGKPIPGFAYLTLIDAIWHSFYQTVTEEGKFNTCPHCHSLHTGRGKYCPPPPGSKRSTCENAANQKKFRDKTKEGSTNGKS